MGYFLSLSKAGAESALNWSEIALLVFGALLVAGLVGEYRTSEKSKWFKRFEMCVILGVLGELFADGAIFVFTSHLETLNALEVAALNTEAGEARKASALAYERAAKAELALEKFKAPRTIDNEAFKRIASELTTFSGQRFQIAFFFDDLESTTFGNRILNLLASSRWEHIKTPNSVGLAFETIVGVEFGIATDASERTKAAAAGAAAALASEGLAAISKRLPGVTSGPDIVIVKVGKKPLA